MRRFILAVGMVLCMCAPGALFAQATTTEAATTEPVAFSAVASTTEIVVPAPADKPTNEGIEAAVRAYFPNAPVMTDIALCESRFRQFSDSGNSLHGGMGGLMIGVFQIHETVHAEYAKSLGVDIHTLEGNLAYAKRLYEREGTTPWISSFPCWGASLPDAAHDTTPGSLVSTLTMGVISSEVMTLQKMLNAAGYTVATEGPGSQGQETTKFGALTRIAVRAFQCAKNIACSGDEYSTGYGLVGVKTRAALIGSSVTATLVANTSAINSTPPAAASQQDNSAEIARLLKIIQELTAQLDALKARSAV